MNHTFRTIWNTTRSALVPVGENTSVAGKGKVGIGGLETQAPLPAGLMQGKDLAMTAAALAVSALFSTGCAWAAADYEEQWDNDFPSASVTHYNNYTVGKGITVTVNKGIDEGDGEYLVNEKARFTVDGVLTNNGTIANEKKDMRWTVGGLVDNKSGASFSAGSLEATKGSGEIIRNAGTIDIGTLKGTGDISNTGVLSLDADYALQGTLTNAGTLDLAGLTVQKGSLFKNTASENVSLESLAVSGSVAGETGRLQISGGLTVAEGATLAQSAVEIGSGGSNAGEIAVKHLKLTGGSGTFANQSGAKLAAADGLSIAAGETLTNAGRIESGQVEVKGALENNAALLDKTSGAVFDSLRLSAGAVKGTGGMTVQGALETAQDTAFTQNTVTAAGAVKVNGQFSVNQMLVMQSTGAFGQTAAGTIAEATAAAAITHEGSMTFRSLASSSKIDNQAGTLTIGTLTGESSLKNAEGAELAMSGGTQHAASLENAGKASLGTFTASRDVSNSGELTASGTLSAKNYRQSAGSAKTADVTIASALETAGTFAATGAVRTASGTNAGVFSADSLTASTSFSNSGTLSTSHAADLTNFTQSAGSAEFGSATLKGKGTLAGTLKTGGNLTISQAADYSGTAAVASEGDLSILGSLLTSGKVSAKGKTSVAAGEKLSAGGLSLQKAEVSGTLAETGNGTIAELVMTKGATLTNAGTLAVTKGSALDGVTYEQTKNGAITFADGQWFSHSSLNVYGGSIERGAAGLGIGNTYNIKRDGAGDLSDVSEGWMNGRTVVSADMLTLENTVNILEGGVLDADRIVLTGGSGVSGDEKTLSFRGGALVTTLDQLFAGVSSKALDMEAMDDDDRIVISGEAVGVTSVEGFASGIREHVDFGTGDIVFTDALVSTNLVADVAKHIADAAGSPDNISVHYTGTFDKLFTAKVANDVIDNNKSVRAIFDNSTLYVRDDANPAGGKTLLIADSDEADSVRIKDDIGFANVVETELIRVKDGHEFALVGTTSGGSLIGTNGAVEVSGDGSIFTLGSLGRSDALTGRIAKATLLEGGTLQVKSQSYEVGAIDAQSGTVKTGAGAKLSADSLSLGAKAVLKNEGTLALETWQDAAGADATTSGTLTVAEDAVIAGSLKAEAGAATVFEGKVTVTGKVENAAKGRSQGMVLGALDVAANEGFVNNGALEVKGDVNLLAGNESAAASGKYAFRNGKGATADLTAGTLTIGVSASHGVEYSKNSSSRAESAAASKPVFAVLLNEGTLQAGDVLVAKGAQLQNAAGAQASASNLTVEAGALLWNKRDAALSAERLDAEGSVRNFGTLSVREGDFAGEGQSIANNGRFYFERFSLASGAAFLNEGEMAAQDAVLDGTDTKLENGEGKKAEYGTLVIRNGASYENSGELHAYESLELTGEGSRLAQKGGRFSGGAVKIDGGSLLVTGGEFLASGEVDFLKGEIQIDGSAASEDASPVSASLALLNGIGGDLSVESAVLTLGAPEGDAASAASAEKARPTASHVLVIERAPADLGSTGRLAVGEGAAAHLLGMRGGDAWFGRDSLLSIDTAGGMTNVEAAGGGTTVAALAGEGSLMVEAGAKLHVKNVGWGTYYVTKDFASESLAVGSWESLLSFEGDPQKDIRITQDQNGNVLLTVVKNDGSEEGGESGGGSSDDGRVDFLDAALENNIQAVISNPDLRDPNAGGAVGFINRAVEIDDDAKLIEAVNAAANFTSAAGFTAESLMLAQNAADAAERHLSYADVHFQKGKLAPWSGIRWWGNAIGEKFDLDSARFTGGKAAFDGENTGFIFGADFLADDGLRVGAAFAAQRGNLDSKGGLVKSANDSDAYSITAYGAKEIGRINFIGSLGWTHVESDLSQRFDALGAGRFGEHQLSIESDVVTLAFRGEMRLPLFESCARSGAFVPHAGLRAVSVMDAEGTSTFEGGKAFRYEVDSITQFAVPVGAALEAEAQTDAGWRVRGLFDASISPVFGDRSAKTAVFGAGLDAVDLVEGETSGRWAAQVRTGLSAEKNGLAFGGELGLAKGGAADAALSVSLGARWAF